MVRKYIKKSTRLTWQEDQMRSAIQDVLNGKTINAAATEYGVPASTLQRKCKECTENLPPVVLKKGNLIFLIFTNIIM